MKIIAGTHWPQGDASINTDGLHLCSHGSRPTDVYPFADITSARVISQTVQHDVWKSLKWGWLGGALGGQLGRAVGVVSGGQVAHIMAEIGFSDGCSVILEGPIEEIQPLLAVGMHGGELPALPAPPSAQSGSRESDAGIIAAVIGMAFVVVLGIVVAALNETQNSSAVAASTLPIPPIPPHNIPPRR